MRKVRVLEIERMDTGQTAMQHPFGEEAYLYVSILVDT